MGFCLSDSYKKYKNKKSVFWVLFKQAKGQGKFHNEGCPSISTTAQTFKHLKGIKCHKGMLSFISFLMEFTSKTPHTHPFFILIFFLFLCIFLLFSFKHKWTRPSIWFSRPGWRVPSFFWYIISLLFTLFCVFLLFSMFNSFLPSVKLVSRFPFPWV